MVANSLYCLQRKQHSIDLGVYLGRRPMSSLHDVLAQLIIIPNGDVEGETACPLLGSFIIDNLTCCVLEDFPHPECP
jgi:hypothetical protein